jgi:hypothetical protein
MISGVTGPHLPIVEGGQDVEVRQDQARLVEGADEVLAAGGVDGGLAAHRGIHLGQEGGGDLDEVDAALVDRGGEAGEVAHHAAAEGDDHVAAVELQGQEAVADVGQPLPALGGLAGGNDDGLGGDAGGGEGVGQGLAMERPDGFVADDGGAAALEERGHMDPGVLQQPLADHDVVGPVIQPDTDGAAHA